MGRVETTWWDLCLPFTIICQLSTRNFGGRCAAILVTPRVLITVSIELWMRGIANSSIPKFDLTVPWPESDRLDGHLWATISGMITIAKVQFWDTGSACFNPPFEGESGGGSRVLQTSLEGDQSIVIAHSRGRLKRNVTKSNHYVEYNHTKPYSSSLVPSLFNRRMISYNSFSLLLLKRLSGPLYEGSSVFLRSLCDLL
jgi:hypothetical protein